MFSKNLSEDLLLCLRLAFFFSKLQSDLKSNNTPRVDAMHRFVRHIRKDVKCSQIKM